jgi:hypothetical protein
VGKPETNYRLSIEKRLPPELHHEKMANPYSGGTADSYYDGNKADIWVEWKFITAFPKRATTIVVPDLSPLQKDWLKGRYENGRRVFVIVGSPNGAHIFGAPRECLAISTKDKENFCQFGWESGVAVASWANLSRDQIAQWIVKATMRL